MKPLKRYIFSTAWIMLYMVVGSTCHSQKYTPEDYSGKQLIFGNGGGFTGQVMQYNLLENGQLFATNTLTKEIKELDQVSKTQVKQLFNTVNEAQLGKLNFNHPGNLYYFIRLKEGDTIQEVIWGSSQHQPPPAIQELYQQIIDFTIKK